MPSSMKKKRKKEVQLGGDVEEREPKCRCEYERREVGVSEEEVNNVSV
jgi:hypothetical protein